MRVKSNTIDEILSPFLNRFQKENITRKEVKEKPPLRSELFSTEQMDQHAQQLASTHILSKKPAPELLLKRLDENEEILFGVTNLLHDDVSNKKSITPAGEWLLDNFYLIEEQILIGKRYLPKGYSKGLPRLESGPFAGFPRVYDIAVQIISHSDGRVDINSLSSFITAYQKINYLTLGELWAIPIMLRLALLENLSRVTAQIAIDRDDAVLAADWGDKVIATAEENPKDLVLIIADMARSEPPMVSAFVAEFTRKLQWKGLDLTLPLTWMEQNLSEVSSNINSMVLVENQKQAADQLSMSNSINSLRFLVKTDWREVVETLSIVEQTLLEDIGSVYANMSFYTRDDYRHAVERIAKYSHATEYEATRAALNLAKRSAEKDPSDKRKSHVGYYLVGAGLKHTEAVVNVNLSSSEKFRRIWVKINPSLYVLIGLLITAGIYFGLMEKASAEGLTNYWLILMAVLTLLIGSQFAISIANWLATIWVLPKQLPKMDYSSGIPPECHTAVVVPTIIGSIEQAEKIIEDLEVRFLGNRDRNLLFALLTDFKDAPQQTMPGDDALITFVSNSILELNTKYGRQSYDTFFLFHRPRQWNAKEKVWMGYERKRGKLTELNHLFRGSSKESFSVIVGEENIYTNVKYIITLDTDTQLPRDAACKLVGLMAHPLNQPVYSENKKRIVKGYGIVQPRIAISLQGATRSRYTRMHENDSGIDPYTRVTSDVYQDVFGEGSFIGKGIYDIDAFELTLNDRFPDNRILSHDLLEGSYARCGFASDVQFYEEYPSRYSMDISRRHRWIRGDWQIWNWFLPFVPGKKKMYKKNPISLLSKWKIFDNLRRSLIPVALFAMLVMSWMFFTYLAFWTLFLATIILLPSLITSVWSLFKKPKEIEHAQHVANTVRATWQNVLQIMFMFACLPYEAYISIHAIGRTLWRMFISHKKLLEWNPSGVVIKSRETFAGTYMKMWIAPLGSIVIFAYLLKYNPHALIFAVSILIIWLLSPALVWWVSKPLASSKTKITDEQHYYLRELARKTWAFFENLVGEEDNWLPPDNLQQYPIPVVAHRTSPTNIGLSLLANLTAHDFGYATTSQLLERTINTFSTMEKLERYLGHFYNWIDTKTLQILRPRYISTVDSGNLAGHLLTLRQGLLNLPYHKIVEPKLISGLHDTLRIIKRLAHEENEAIIQFIKAFEERGLPSTLTLEDYKNYLDNLNTQYRDVLLSDNNLHKELLDWVNAFEIQLKNALDEILFLAPWLISPSTPEKYKSLNILHEIPTLDQLAVVDKELRFQLENPQLTPATSDELNWLSHIEASMTQASIRARERITTLQKLAIQCYDFADIEYAFLYDKAQGLLAIGYNVDEHHRDASYYDLLASEARLSSFVAIAQGKLPQESWFSLGRRLTSADNTPVLLSWSGSMFEYLMPLLVMPSYENTLLDETCKGTVKRQIEYGRQQNIPWGISESCYNLVDSSLIYQYRAFGVPGLGFKRGLGLDLVVAPYATVLALMVDPKAACSNLEVLKQKGFEGKYGFFEAIDYTPSRLPRDKPFALIQTFMAHHQGMSFLSLAYLLLDQPMQRRFESDPEFQTALLLLQEQVPKTTAHYLASTEMEDITPVSSHAQIRIINTPKTAQPEVQLLSNGKYHVMVTNGGGGYSRWRDLAVTRWREDATCDNWGSFCYIRNLDTKEFWSNTYHPTLKEPTSYASVFSQGRVEFRRRDGDIETYTEIIVSPEDDVEIRRIHLTNRSKSKQNLEFTTYTEVVLALPIADAAHPAFSNLFVQTEILEHQQAILCTRRPRSKDEQPPWMFHLLKLNGDNKLETSYETDRLKFIGRGYGIEHPLVMDGKDNLSGSQGSVLDPIVSIRHKLLLKPDEVVTVDIITGIAGSREVSQSQVDKYQDRHMRDRAFELSWTHSQVVLRQINASEEEAELYGRLAGSVIYNNPALRASSNIIAKNLRGQSALWSYSISGDLPIVLLEVSDSSNITLVKQLIQAQAYWHLKGLAADLVILNEDPSGYRQVLQDQIQGLIAAGIGTATIDKPGRIFVRPVEQVSAEDLILLKSVARVIISDSRGTLKDQVNRRITAKIAIPYINNTVAHAYTKLPAKVITPSDLLFYNGSGGFSPDGKEYIIITNQKDTTPLPWINVIANKKFGTVVTESGPSYTWSENAHGLRLTPWNNDPVTDSSGEAYYLRDEENDFFWSPMPSPARSEFPYITRHGFGYTKFENVNDGIVSQVTTYVDLEAAIKFVVIKVRNNSGRARNLSATGYAEWVLSNLRSKSAMHIVTEVDAQTGALIASNPYNTEFPGRVGFFDVDDAHYGFTTDRSEFIGRNGTLKNPDAMKRVKLSGKSGAGFDPCSAIQVSFDLEIGASREIIFRMGAGINRYEAVETIKQFRGSKAAALSLEKVKSFWDHTLGAVQIETPDPSLNILTNGWLVYQVMACRLWGRTGFYQSGGAFGYRDQLQDVLALMHAEPSLTREQILLAASRQFAEGDVQHWWHPPVGRGVRTMCSDDFLWLSYVTSRYVTTTGDFQILEEVVPFIEGRPLNMHEESYYDLPIISEKRSTLYEHCKRALEHALKFGEHGLPFMGSGDWNDGMNMVGILGKGESVWLGFFLYDALNKFIPIANQQHDQEFAGVCKNNMTHLQKSINDNAWDGNWYRRAYFDDGTPLGSSKNEDCKIDSIAQSWSILSGAGLPERTHTAMQSVNQYLINRDKGLLQLLEPPFDKADLDPGYIKGYVPGVRENGGQYTHAAIWMVMAFAKLKDQHHTWELLSMINPINHGKSADDISVYKAEPYVMAADVYGVHPHTGRGGWTWYTGSAGWMYQLIIESFLGLNRVGDKLMFNPCIPTAWPSFKLRYRYVETWYHIEVKSDNDLSTVVLDGIEQADNVISLVDDRTEHRVLVKVKYSNAEGVMVKINEVVN